ncbi:transposase [Lysinibacillus xylanilyticus]|uniref:transposase n=1 Tax=Lysinibacillus xylanilyticus TaxID=582475 RepID=UPI003821287D
MNIARLKDVEITKAEEVGDRIALYVQLPKCTHECLVCKKEISKVHDYRIQRMGMNPSIKGAVRQSLGLPVIVAERFHFSRYIYWAMDKCADK